MQILGTHTFYIALVLSFDAHDIQLMQSGQLPSVFCEVKNVRLVIDFFL